ncbi:MAG: hypothetical protein UX49_C0021G0012 [Candidatus Wolfebacteria bacterium GW2011_GWC2_46_275]|uniref:Uncharacterized protein n=2 Tax=Candidatus Wolfeibacteriota TaxID=1752735 RepID=A0A0G1U8S6_9BACT|nr:MAG: hypothetical protein UX70_C0001G0807 [Candidatus Wolfebacteria bacterium GW2011_GWB1_47_1]KKU36188.1 MAG: hypothetical protein UX49_C0021G0012 [Candidatus Wolfebacteria bacterium GW2011_GWC2_46_275]KKU42095.1 MAG: hypothetical protein UX58_C0003G0019 [Candidatus Wolfebacteria bacterium GW2011_GWB2_46_69]KKU59316.1 MAG: hypothetical protein UX83_C0006G0086 [Candidatus Wolfebacteria bacterium GW2011_GWE2_47_12]KKU66066.1 MAG: hypothetical protein UX90_C0001G0125 [Candidatus Wolfebacteria 
MKKMSGDKKAHIEKVLIPQKRIKHKMLIKGFKKKRVDTKEAIKQLLSIQ